MSKSPIIAAFAVALAFTGLAGTAGAATPKNVHIRGTVYEFYGNGSASAAGGMAGAVVRVYENSKLSATVGSDGNYDLLVPAKATAITPYVTMAGYYPIALQTFKMAGKDLAHVNFQTPTDSISMYLMMLLNVTPANPLVNPWRAKDCVIVSTFNVKAVRNMDYPTFSHYGSHGIADATASAKPALKGQQAPVYFNDQTVPDRSLKASTVDGGVILTRIPAGKYVLTAKHKTAKFASFTATCKAGRVINASPPWGFYQTA